MKKQFVIDTNILIYDPESLFMFEDNDIFLSIVTLQEITHLKDRDDEVGYEARCVKRYIAEIRKRNMAKGEVINPENGLFLGDGLGKLYIVLNEDFSDFKDTMTKTQNDDRILAAAAWVKRQHPELETILITDDVDLCFYADIIGVPTDEYRNKKVDHKYTGRKEISVPDCVIQEFYQKGFVEPDDEWELQMNEFILAKGYAEGSFIGFFNGKHILPLKKSNPYDVIPRNNAQKYMIHAMMDDNIPLVIVKGPAGTAKTFISLACGLEQVIEENKYERVLISRANIQMDETYGYLPGTELEKVSPMMRSFSDNISNLTSEERVQKDDIDCPSMFDWLVEQGKISVEALQYMRGRSLKNTFVIIDEAQNCTPGQVLAIISRIGENSKVILIGDPEQIDNRHLNRSNNGLVYAAERFIGSELCAQLTTKENECERSKLAQAAISRLS